MGDRSHRGGLGRGDRNLDGYCAGSKRGDNDVVGARGDQRSGPTQPSHLPEIPSQDGFTCSAFHLLEWNHSVDLRGKRVALIGAGASGFQIAPAIAGDVAQLTVFQRTAQWMFPNPSYHEAVGPGVQWALRHLPFYRRWYRFLLFWPFCDKGLDAARVDPDYPDQQRAVSEVNDIARIMFTEWILKPGRRGRRVAGQCAARLSSHRKRTLQDNGSWLGTLKRDNVDLVRNGIARIEPDAVVTDSAVSHGADIIMYATGF